MPDALVEPRWLAMLAWLALAGTVALYILYVGALGLISASRVGTLALTAVLDCRHVVY